MATSGSWNYSINRNELITQALRAARIIGKDRVQGARYVVPEWVSSERAGERLPNARADVTLIDDRDVPCPSHGTRRTDIADEIPPIANVGITPHTQRV